MNNMLNRLLHRCRKTLPYIFVLLISNSALAFVSPIGDIELPELLDRIVASVIFISFPVIVLMLVYTGFLFVQAQGNPTKLSEARKVFVWTLIGAFIILASRVLKDVVVDTVNQINNS